MKQIAEALAATQAGLPLVIRKADKGHHNSYASFETILEKVRPILNTHGLSILQVGEVIEGQCFCKVTVLLHTSGESIEGVWPVVAQDNKQLTPRAGVGQWVDICASIQPVEHPRHRHRRPRPRRTGAAPAQARAEPTTGASAYSLSRKTAPPPTSTQPAS